MYRNILVATDGSPFAAKAVSHGVSLAKSVGARVTALIVENPQHAQEIKQHGIKVLSQVADAAKAAGVPCDTLQLEHDEPYQAIINTAKDKGCDLIVIASHGRGGIMTVLLGSVTYKVLTHTKIPVLVCR